jgi:hypothetical protein
VSSDGMVLPQLLGMVLPQLLGMVLPLLLSRYARLPMVIVTRGYSDKSVNKWCKTCIDTLTTKSGSEIHVLSAIILLPDSPYAQKACLPSCTAYTVLYDVTSLTSIMYDV